MSTTAERRPPAVSRFVLADGRTAALVPRERTHLSALQNGYPLTESFLDELAADGVDTIVIDDEEGLHLFELSRYRRGNRVGHAPYPMKRVAPLDEAADPLGTPSKRETGETDAALDEWEWVTEADLRPSRERLPEMDHEDGIEGSIAH